jgi:Co/Zn/Cd efflux system component
MIQLVQLAATESLKWDPTISLGTIVTIFAFVLTILGAAWRLSLGIHEAKSDVQDLKRDFGEMKPKVDTILVLQQQQVDHDRRVSRLEDAVFQTKKP